MSEWLDTFLVSPADTVSLVIGLAVVGFVAYIAWYLGTVFAETLIHLIEKRERS